MKNVKEYYSENCIKAEGSVENGKKEGLWIFYYPDGKKNKEINYKVGIENGIWLMWHENGNLYIEQSKINGKTNGLWKEYYENGKIKEIGEYIEGVYTPKDFWDEEGNQLLKNGNGKKIEKFGADLIDVFEHYFENGKLVKEVRV
jgi:antitoxin component YwqK of YwqJK toxin-antitoxin module